MKKGVFNKKGLSEVVTTLLFVLLALGAVLLVWFVVKGLIGGGAANVNLQKACLDLGVEVKSCTIKADGSDVSVVYQRGNTEIPDDMKFNKLSLVFEMASGETSVVSVTDGASVPDVLESKVKKVTIGESPTDDLTDAPSKVGIAGVLLVSGSDSSCTESARVTCTRAA